MKTTTISGWVGLGRPTFRLQTPRFSWSWTWPCWRWLRTALVLAGLALLFVKAGPLLRLADPTAAVVDAGTLSLVLLAVVALVAFLTVSRWLSEKPFR